MAIALLVLGAVALVFAVFVQTKASDTAERSVPIDPNNAGPDTVLAGAAGVAGGDPADRVPPLRCHSGPAWPVDGP